MPRLTRLLANSDESAINALLTFAIASIAIPARAISELERPKVAACQ